MDVNCHWSKSWAAAIGARDKAKGGWWKWNPLKETRRRVTSLQNCDTNNPPPPPKEKKKKIASPCQFWDSWWPWKAKSWKPSVSGDAVLSSAYRCLKHPSYVGSIIAIGRTCVEILYLFCFSGTCSLSLSHACICNNSNYFLQLAYEKKNEYIYIIKSESSFWRFKTYIFPSLGRKHRSMTHEIKFYLIPLPTLISWIMHAYFWGNSIPSCCMPVQKNY